ncbi:MAG: ATP-binding protein, partial [Gammaproteobacteria bacterium]
YGVEGATMGSHMADVMIHIDETLSEESLKRIEASVREDVCVISAGVPAGNPHMMLVAYNPDGVSATDILARVKRAGVHAELVGM